MAEQIERINQKIERIETEIEMLQKVVLRLIKKEESVDRKDIWTFISEVNTQREKDTLNLLNMIKELKNGK